MMPAFIGRTVSPVSRSVLAYTIDTAKGSVWKSMTRR